MRGRRLKPNCNSYQICVTIIEARHLQQNANSMVVIKIGNHKRKTLVREKSDCPIYNEYFVFDFNCTLDELLSTKIMLAVYTRKFLKRFKFYASILFEVANVWDQPDHQYYHKWAMLTNPKNAGIVSKGYVKCNIIVNVKGERMRINARIESEDDIEKNLLLPIGGNALTFRHRVRYIFTIYRADGLPNIKDFHFGSNGDDIVDNINPSLQITFAGMKGTTSEIWETRAPEFNEKLIFKEIFPPFCHRARIAIRHRIDKCRSCVVASHVINLLKISKSGDHGFLPSYGPSFVHFYGESSAESLKSLPLYRGRVLISLKTEIDDLLLEESRTTESNAVRVESAVPIVETNLWKSEEYLLAGVIYDACTMEPRCFKGKSISFEMSFGEESMDSLEEQTDYCGSHYGGGSSRTEPRVTNSFKGEYDHHVPFESRKPCMHVKSCWPRLNWRIFNSNNLSFILRFLREKLEILETLIATDRAKTIKTYNETIRTLKIYCTRYLSVLETERYNEEGGGTTKLDRHRINVCREEIEDILRKIRTNEDEKLSSNQYLRMAMIRLYQCARKLEEIQKDPQHSLPDVFLCMLVGSKRVAYSRLSAREIIHSEKAEEKGKYCGQTINVFLKNHATDAYDRSVCRIEIFLWLGSVNFQEACWRAIPPGYQATNDTGHFPRFIEYHLSSKYQLRAHIFQGRFDPGMDFSGLLDPVVQIEFRGYSQATKAIRQSLDPLWDQTLVFPTVQLYGSNEHVKHSPPKLVMQIYDQDFCGTKEFCGRCVATPLVKLASETYSPPDFPPRLTWYRFKSQRGCDGSVLAAFELIEVGEESIVDVPMNATSPEKIYNIPDDIRPRMTSYRLEIVFWGVRDMKKIHYLSASKPRIVIECLGVRVKSEVMENVRKFSNFHKSHVMIDLSMPDENIYLPPVTIKAYVLRGLDCYRYVGVCIIPTVEIFLKQLITEQDYYMQIYRRKRSFRKSRPIKMENEKIETTKDENTSLLKEYVHLKFWEALKNIWRKGFLTIRNCRKSLGRKTSPEICSSKRCEETLDWWCKYFSSFEELRNDEETRSISDCRKHRKKPVVAIFEIYSTELEVQPQFRGFQDRLTSFELWRGKRINDRNYSSDNYAGKFKGHISVYRWPHPENLPCKTINGRNVRNGLCNDYWSQEPIKLLVRLYVIRGINLHPSDPLSGKSDPYLYIKLGKKVINDQKNFIPNQLNPVFGKLFEIEASFPRDYLLTIQVWDYDRATSDDLIGETQIDIENRFYSVHRAHCGLAKYYSVSGYNAWRDCEKPTEILELLCRKNNLPLPEYSEEVVRIGKHNFPFDTVVDRHNDEEKMESMALNVLHHWQDFPICGCALVPEHVERRPLFNPHKPGLEQGKLELWIDMFQYGHLPMKPPVDVRPQAPEEYEIRAIVWNTEDVPLTESQFLTGEKSSDIYVKGWILEDDSQKTDVHYNSLTGEGNFNWRFVFRVNYLKGEQTMLIRKKVSVLAKYETEQKLPCRLHLQVWDSDHFSPDDFLGALTIDLSKMSRGSSNSRNCTLKVLDRKSPKVNLFKIGRIKGWWPFVRTMNGGQEILAGKVELELSVLPAMEADENPVGKGRNPPSGLSAPKRPDTSFSWFRNPWKAFCFVVCRYYRWRIILCCTSSLLILLFLCAIYAFPGYLVKRLLGA